MGAYNQHHHQGGQSSKAKGLTLYNEPSAPTEQPSSRYPILLTMAAIPHALSLAARRPTSFASARKNCRSASVVSNAKKCEKMPMIMRSSSVGSLQNRGSVNTYVCHRTSEKNSGPLHKRQESGVEAVCDLNLVRVLTEEDSAFVDELANNEAKNLAEVATRDKFLLAALGRSVGRGRRHPRRNESESCAHLKRLFAGFI